MEVLHEPTIIEFARLHNLCHDHSAPPHIDLSLFRPSVDTIVFDLKDPSGSTSDLHVDAQDLTHEKFGISREDALYLADVQHVFAYKQAVPTFEVPASHTRSAKELKLEDVILRSDHESDVRAFTRRCPTPKLAEIEMPMEAVNDEADEGLGWPPDVLNARRDADELLATEKLAVAEADMKFLQSCKKGEASIFEIVPRRRKDPMREPLTPVLLPLSPATSPPLPPVDAGFLELPSDVSNAVHAEVTEFEGAIFQEDVITLLPHTQSNNELDAADPDIDTDMLEAFFDDIVSIPPAPEQTSAADLKVEPPLTPPTDQSSAMKRMKTVEFADILGDTALPLPAEAETLNDLSDFDTFFDLDVSRIAEAAHRKVEQEQLVDVDTTQRVDVPIVDFSQPIPPWEMHGLKYSKSKQRGRETEMEAQIEFFGRVIGKELRLMTTWHSPTSETKLKWIPFPKHIAAEATKETAADDAALEELLDKAGPPPVTSSSLIWKPDGLRILDDDEDSCDELEPAEFEDSDDFDSILRKRKVELDHDMLMEPQRKAMTQPQTWSFPEVTDKRPLALVRGSEKSVDAHVQEQVRPQKRVRTKDTEPISFSGNMFSASNSLSKFLALQGKFLPGPSPDTPKSPTAPRPAPIPPLTKLATQSEVHSPPAVILDLPPLPQPLPLTPIVISTTLLSTHLSLYRALLALHPNLPVIECDYTAPFSPSQEADIILSPSHGLILTTLQKLKQRSLPGQEPSSKSESVLNRVRAVSGRYAWFGVWVLPSTGFAAVTGVKAKSIAETEQITPVTLDASDALAITNLTASLAALPTDSHVNYIPSSSTTYIARLLLRTIAQYAPIPVSSAKLSTTMTVSFGPAKFNTAATGLDSTAPTLLPDTTYWELLLRHTGLNPYAAQSILYYLKEPISIPLAPQDLSSSTLPSSELVGSEGRRAEVETVTGLPAFILMSQEERERRFAVMMGGTRVLRRVGEVLDGRWVSARDGFAALRE